VRRRRKPPASEFVEGFVATRGITATRRHLQADDGPLGTLLEAFIHPSSATEIPKNKVVKIHPSSFLTDRRSPAIMYNELVSLRMLSLNVLVRNAFVGVYDKYLCTRGISGV
jgi:hypothetical protein